MSEIRPTANQPSDAASVLAPATSPEVGRVIGAMLGLAIGDALGAPFEGWPPQRIVERLGAVDDYVDLERLPGLYTSRSQQALCLLDALLEEGRFSPDDLALRLVAMSKALHQKWPIYGAFRGTSRGFRDAVDRLADGVSWRESGTLSAGNEPALRVVPLALWSRDHRVVQFREDVIESAWVTHRDPRALAGALAFAFAIVHVVNLERPSQFDARSFLRAVADFTHDAEAVIAKRWFAPDLKLPHDAVHDLSNVLRRGEGWLGLSPDSLVAQVTRFARPLGDREVRGTSPFVVASLTTALVTFARLAGTPQDALIEAINLGGDTSGIGGMVGALSGGLQGMRAFRDSWVIRLKNAAAIRQRAESLALGEGLPEGAPRLVRMEAASTEAELPRLKARHSHPSIEEERGQDDN
ncbi:MAG: ADP-ribosylglycohydrolase family protein [Anaerolineae bacterium]